MDLPEIVERLNTIQAVEKDIASMSRTCTNTLAQITGAIEEMRMLVAAFHQCNEVYHAAVEQLAADINTIVQGN